jgi:hypothetical protein
VAEAEDHEAFFTLAGAELVPAPHARGPWAPGMMHGRLLGGLMAWAVEREHAEAGLHIARFTVDLFRRADLAPVRVTTRRVRDGGRIRVVDASVTIGGGEVARASAVLLRRGERPPGEMWSTPGWDAPGPDELGPPMRGAPFQLWRMGIDSAEDRSWTAAEPRRAWVREAYDLIAGESPSPFVRVALAADLTSPMALFGTAGLRYINADYSLTLGRLPLGDAIGLESGGHLADEGVATGHCTVYDTAGPLGYCVITAIANNHRS